MGTVFVASEVRPKPNTMLRGAQQRTRVEQVHVVGVISYQRVLA